MKKLEEILQTYRQVEFYRDKGQQTSTIANKIDGTKTNNTISFETHFDRKGYFKFNFSKFDQQDALILKGLILKEINEDKVKSVIDWVGKEPVTQEIDIYFALATHTGISQKLSHTIPFFLYGNADAHFYGEGSREESDEEVNGIECMAIRTSQKIESRTPTKEELEKAKAQFQDLPSIADNIKKIEDEIANSKTEHISFDTKYYFQRNDNLLIKMKYQSISEKFIINSVTEYQPAIKADN